MIILFLLLVIVLYFYLSNKNKKKKTLDCLRKYYLNDDFMSINNLSISNIGNKTIDNFGKESFDSLNENDQKLLSNILGIQVKPYDKIAMPYFFGGTLYPYRKGYESIKSHHVIFRIYKKNYNCELGKKEFFSIIVERHYGSCVWDGKEMHYPYKIEEKIFRCTLSNFEKTWVQVKNFMFE